MNALERQFAQTVKEHQSTIYTVCYMFSQDAEGVNDLFQEVLVNLWKGFDSFEHRSDIKTWIYRVALNTCISIDRKKKRRSSEVQLTLDINLFEDRDEDTRQVDMLHKASPSSNPSIVRLSSSGSRISLTRKSDRLSASAPRMSVSVCSGSENN